MENKKDEAILFRLKDVMQQLYSAGIVVFRKENDVILYLLLHYPHGHWDLPKGKIEEGETKEQAALRELKEETGLTAQILPEFQKDFSYFFKQDGQLIKKTVTFFIGKTDESEVELSFEHIGFKWLPFEQALERLTFKNAKELLVTVNEYLHSKNV